MSLAADGQDGNGLQLEQFRLYVHQVVSTHLQQINIMAVVSVFSLQIKIIYSGTSI